MNLSMYLSDADGFAGNRKDQHVQLAQKFYNPETASDFEQTRFVHHSLPEMSVKEVDLSTEIAGLKVDFPFFVNAMTGGSERTAKINRSLGVVGYYSKIPIASGSVSAAIKDSSVASSFSVLRRENPTGIIFANIGAHHDVDIAKRAVDLLEANALQVHLNAPQEMIMPEGDRDFSMWLRHIEQYVKELNVPVIVKEVGFGMSRETVARLHAVGVQTVDVAGTGGTNFAQIENHRRTLREYTYLEDLGQSTVVSLVEALSLDANERPAILASGGVKNAFDIVKSLAIGADAVGLSNYFLQIITQSNGEDLFLQEVSKLKEDMAHIMTLLGARTISDLRKTDMILGPSVQDWCQARRIDWRRYANRSQHS